MKIDNQYEKYLAGQGISLDLSNQTRDLLELAENVYAMAFNANCYSHIRTLLLQHWQKHEEVLRVSGAFIHFTVNALTTSIVIEVCKIFDSHKDAKAMKLFDKKTIILKDSLPALRSGHFDDSLQDIANTIERDWLINKLKRDYEVRIANELIRLSNQFPLLNPVIKNVKEQRNKLYAHNAFVDEREEADYISDNPIILADINMLIDFALDYSTVVIAAITGLNRSKKPANINDLDGLMQYILHGYDAIQVKIKNIMHHES
jgi:hypothetical protein